MAFKMASSEDLKKELSCSTTPSQLQTPTGRTVLCILQQEETYLTTPAGEKKISPSPATATANEKLPYSGTEKFELLLSSNGLFSSPSPISSFPQ